MRLWRECLRASATERRWRRSRPSPQLAQKTVTPTTRVATATVESTSEMAAACVAAAVDSDGVAAVRSVMRAALVMVVPMMSVVAMRRAAAVGSKP